MFTYFITDTYLQRKQLRSPGKSNFATRGLPYVPLLQRLVVQERFERVGAPTSLHATCYELIYRLRAPFPSESVEAAMVEQKQTHPWNWALELEYSHG